MSRCELKSNVNGFVVRKVLCRMRASALSIRPSPRIFPGSVSRPDKLAFPVAVIVPSGKRAIPSSAYILKLARAVKAYPVWAVSTCAVRLRFLAASRLKFTFDPVEETSTRACGKTTS